MEKRTKHLDYFITSAGLLGIGLLFFFLNQTIQTAPVLHFSLFQILQSAVLLIVAALRCYGDSAAHLPPPDETDAARSEDRRDAADSANATLMLLVAAILVVGYYMFSMTPQAQAAETAAPLHLVICVVVLILYICAERWWAMQLSDAPEADAVCNLLVLNKLALAALLADLAASLTGVVRVTDYADALIFGLWLYVSLMAMSSVAWKLFRHGREIPFRLYLFLPIHRSGGKEMGGALVWLEQNTGISMRSLWSLQLIRTALPACGFAVAALLWLSTCVVQIESYQQGALYHFGRLSQENILDAGLHFKLPIPFDTVVIYPVTQPQSMVVGYEGDATSKNNLWTRPHGGEEQTLLLGNGKELVAINLKITYRISDLYAYLTNFASPEQVLNAKGYEIVMDETISTNIDTIISSDRSVLSHRIEDRLKAYAQTEGLGLEVMSVTLASIHPPVAVADIYQSVVSADTQRKTTILTAEGEALVAREEAQAQRQIAVNDAGIQRDERVSSAKAEVAEYNASIEAYQLDPQSYRLNKYLEAFESAMSGQRKYLVSPGVDTSALYGDFGSGIRGQWFGAGGSAAQRTEEGA